MHPIEEIASRVFAIRNIAHRTHWKTTSFATHEALGAFYDSIIDVIDEIVEADQGMHGLIGDFVVKDAKVDNIENFIRAEAQWIEENRANFSKCNAVLALVDDLVVIYLKTAYKLANLK